MAEYSPRIATISGIDIELHWTFIILLLISLAFSVYLFLVMVLLFMCVLVHELFHSITSKINGIKVKKIVLNFFGGGSVIDFEHISPSTEFRISLVGPVASLLLAAMFGLLNIAFNAGIVGKTLQTLFILNLFLGAFNLLPWLPLDGGRALRSYLQRRTSFLNATRMAVRSSAIITILFVAGTIAYAALAHGYSLLYREFIVLLDVAIAVFIYGGAQSELQAAFIKENSSDLKVRDAMTKDYSLIPGKATEDKLYRGILGGGSHIVLFRDNGKIMMFSGKPMQRPFRAPSSNGTDLGKPIPSVNSNGGLYGALYRMSSENAGVAAVLEKGKLCGILLASHAESVIAIHMSKKRKKSGTKPSS